LDEENPPQHQKKARIRGAKVVFEDECHFQQEGTTRRSWALKGIGFTVYHEPCKKSSKYFGAISLDSLPDFIFCRAKKFNSRSFEKFLYQIVDHFGKVCLILDNVSYHKSKKIKRVIRRLRGRLWIYPLPPYSPELNATEMVWRETRKDATHNRYFKTGKCLTRAVQTQFRIYQNESWRLSGVIANFLRV
jgi:transposase